MQDPIRVLPGGMARSEEYQPSHQAILGSTGRADGGERVTDAREPDGGTKSSSAGDLEQVTRGPPRDRAMPPVSQDSSVVAGDLTRYQQLHQELPRVCS